MNINLLGLCCGATPGWPGILGLFHPWMGYDDSFISIEWVRDLL
jgi:hypothetical protein